MRIELKLFAALREQLGVAHETLDLPAAAVTVADARGLLMARSPAWRTALAAPGIRVALNQRISSDDARLSEGAELAFFPPVTGG